MRGHHQAGLSAVLAFTALAPAAASAVDVTTCGQVVLAHTTGVLVADLTCPTAAGQAIVVGDRSTLDLAGHTLTGGGVICDRSCTVRGGTITGVRGDGSEVAVFSNLSAGKGRFAAEDLTVSASDNGLYIKARRVDFSNVIANGNHGYGIVTFGAGVVRGADLTANGNVGPGMAVQYKGNVRLTRFTATGNGWGGLINQGRSTRLYDSVVTGNDWPPFPDSPAFVDVNARCERLKLFNTTCDHSYPGSRLPPCGVCAAD